MRFDKRKLDDSVNEYYNKPTKHSFRDYTALKIAGIVGGGLLLVASIGGGCNRLCNYKNSSHNGTEITSRPKFLLGHVDYIKHADGTRELIKYSGFGLRMGRMTTYEDRDGDGKADIIRVNSSELRLHRLLNYFDALNDYGQHKSEFEEANKELKQSIQKYDK